MKRLWGLLGILVVLCMLPFASAAQAYLPPSTPATGPGCSITWYENGRNHMLPDFDCDGVTDPADNCVEVPNADQRDINRNGLGDVCDMLIQDITVQPDNQLAQGEFAHITVRAVNSKPQALYDVRVTVHNTALNIDASQIIDFLPPGTSTTRDFWVKIPACAKPQSYTISISADVDGQAQEQNEVLNVKPSDSCGAQQGALDNTVIKLFNELNIEPGATALIPITITNFGTNRTTYIVSASDPTGSSTWRVDPSPRLILGAGQEATVYLYLQTETWRPPGNSELQVTIVSGNQKTTIPVQVMTRVPLRAVSFGPVIFQIILILLLLALILAVIIIAIRHHRKKSTDSNMPVKENKIATPKKNIAIDTDNKKKVETYY